MFISSFDLRHLRTLAALRDTGSLVEASERVFLTQSALSHQIKALETRMGCAVVRPQDQAGPLHACGKAVA